MPSFSASFRPGSVAVARERDVSVRRQLGVPLSRAVSQERRGCRDEGPSTFGLLRTDAGFPRQSGRASMPCAIPSQMHSFASRGGNCGCIENHQVVNPLRSWAMASRP